MVDPYRTHRVQSWWVERLTSTDGPIGILDGVTAGSIEINSNRPIRGTGSLALDDTGQELDFLADRVRVWWQVVGATPFPLGTFLMSAPKAAHGDAVTTWEIALFDKLTVPAEHRIRQAFALPAGTVVTDAVRDLLVAVGESSMSVTDSTATLSAGVVWPAGTSHLEIINDLLARINYFSLWCDGYGRYVVQPYARPTDRPRMWDFSEGADAIHLPEFERAADLAGVPNEVVLTTSGNGDDEALVGVASNDNPASPFSTVSRGRTITLAETAEADDQATIDALAQRRLDAASLASATITMSHEVLPVALNDVATFDTAGVDALAVIEKFTLDLAADALMVTTLREVLA